MPYIGQDWRSPGDTYVKTEDGNWEKTRIWRIKLFEGLAKKSVSRILRASHCSNSSSPVKSAINAEPQNPEPTHHHHTKPHIFLSKRTSRESLNLSSLSEIFGKLDISGAVLEERRFNYVCRAVRIICRDHLASLGGSGQRSVFQVVQQIFRRVMRTGNNLHIGEAVLDDLMCALMRGEINRIGSAKVWQKQLEIATGLRNQLRELRSSMLVNDGAISPKGRTKSEGAKDNVASDSSSSDDEVVDDKSADKMCSASQSTDDLPKACCTSKRNSTLIDLPEELLRMILQGLSNHEDLESAGLANHFVLYGITQENLLWRQLCLFHFTELQISNVGATKSLSLDDNNWRSLYMKLHKRHGLRETYAEMLALCSNCNCLFWQKSGHPCLVADATPHYKTLGPDKFVKLCLN